MIEPHELAALGKSLGRIVKDYVATVLVAVNGRMDILEGRIKGITRGEKGDRGDAGEKGEAGDRGLTGDTGEKGERGIQGETGPIGKDGVPGEKGEKGEPGLTAIGEAGERGPRGEKGETGLIGPQGQPGETGQPGQDGESIHPDTISLMVVTEVAKAVALIPKAKDGEPGRDATQIEVLPTIDPQKSYPRGTEAEYAGGTIRAHRNTEPITARLQDAGWSVVRDGEANFEVIQSADLRTFTFRKTMTSGRVFESVHKSPVTILRGIHRTDDEYFRGDQTISDNSTWTCVVESTKAKPGLSPDWLLSARKGDRGKDGKGEKGDPGQPGKDGKDFRPLGSKW